MLPNSSSGNRAGPWADSPIDCEPSSELVIKVGSFITEARGLLCLAARDSSGIFPCRSLVSRLLCNVEPGIFVGSNFTVLGYRSPRSRSLVLSRDTVVVWIEK